MDTSAYQDFASKVLGVQFQDIELLITAFTHRSYVNEHRKTVHVHNERLEFFGRRGAGTRFDRVFVW